MPPWTGPVQKEKVNPEPGTAVMQTEPFPVLPTTFKPLMLLSQAAAFMKKYKKQNTTFFEFGNNAHSPEHPKVWGIQTHLISPKLLLA